MEEQVAANRGFAIVFKSVSGIAPQFQVVYRFLLNEPVDGRREIPRWELNKVFPSGVGPLKFTGRVGDYPDACIFFAENGDLERLVEEGVVELARTVLVLVEKRHFLNNARPTVKKFFALSPRRTGRKFGGSYCFRRAIVAGRDDFGTIHAVNFWKNMVAQYCTGKNGGGLHLSHRHNGAW